MAHSVDKQLAVAPQPYDVPIRRFVTGHDQMLDQAVGALAEHLPSGVPRVLDLGAGTGARSARIAAACHGRRAHELRPGSFRDPLPPCDAAVASLALHHLHEREAKRDVYRNILQALAPGGLMVSADAMLPAAAALAEASPRSTCAGASVPRR